MNSKTKPRDHKPSGKKAKPLSQKEQSERFIETARELEVDESGQAFERALTKVLLKTRSKSAVKAH